MDIAKLGVAIDPTKAVDGARRATDALKSIGSTAKTELQKVDEAAERAGTAAEKAAAKANKAANDAKRGMGEFRNGVVDAAQAVGLMNGPVGQLIQRTVAIIDTVGRMRAAAEAFRTAQEATTAAARASDAALAAESMRAWEATKAKQAAAAAFMAQTTAATASTAATAAQATAATASAAANATQATSATAAAAATVVHGRSMAAAASAGTAMVATNRVNTATVTALGAAASRSTAQIIAMNGALRTASTARFGGPARLSDPRASAQTIDVGGTAVNSVRNLNSGLIALAGSGGRLPPVLRAVGSSATEAGAGAAAGGMGIAGMVGIATGAIAALAALVAAIVAIKVALAGLGKAFELIKQGMDLAGPVQRTRQSIAVLTGSVTEATRVIKELRTASTDTGADLGGSMDTVKRFLALGFSPDNAIKLNKSLLDVAGSIGLTAAETKLLGMALAQVQAKGVVSMEELRQQIAEKGVPVFEELQKKVGKFGMEFNKAVENGEVPAKALIDIFLNLEGGFAKFAGGAGKMVSTFPGAVGRLKAIWEELLITLGEPINIAITPAINKFSDWLLKMKPAFEQMGNTLANGVKILVQAAQNGEIGTMLGLMLEVGMKKGIDAVWNYFAGMMPNFSAQIREMIWMGATLALTAIAQLLINSWSWPIKTVASLFVSLMRGAIDVVMNVLTLGLWGSSKKSSEDFSTNGSKAAKYIGTAVLNELGQAFEDVINIFWSGMKSMVTDIALHITEKIGGAVAGAVRMLPAGQAVLDAAALALKASSGPTIMGPPKPDPGLDIFTPWPQPDISTLYDGSVLPPKDPNTPELPDAQQRLMDMQDELIAKFDRENFPDRFGPPKPYTPPPALPTTEVSNAIPKAKIVKEPKIKEPTIEKAEEVRSMMADLMKEWGDLGKQMDATFAGIAQSIAYNMTDALTGMINGTKGAKEAFSEMASSIINDIIQMIIQMTIQLAISKALGGYGAAFQGIAVSGSTGPLAHSGGTVGETNFSQASMPKYHQGGKLSSESVVKVDKGETILTRRRSNELAMELAAARGDRQKDTGGGSTSATIINVLDRNEIGDAVAKNPGAVMNAMSRNLPAVRKMILSGQRP